MKIASGLGEQCLDEFQGFLAESILLQGSV